ncbi:MAG: biotin synthase-like enzyme [Desulforhopalus sp.]
MPPKIKGTVIINLAHCFQSFFVTIVNAKAGQCSEDCKFCAQSAHHDVEVASYDLVNPVKAIALAKEKERRPVRVLFKINYIQGC